MILGILGTCDKRTILYPLLKLLNESGDVIFITDNNQFKRLIDGMDYGQYKNITVYVSQSSPDEIWQEIGYTTDDFDHVVYDLKYYLADNVDKYVYLYTVERREDELEILELLDEYLEFKLIFGKPLRDEKKIPHIKLTMRDLYAVEYTEVARLPGWINPSLNSALYSIAGDFLGISKKRFPVIMKKGEK